jgi:hypothetical protein
VLQILMYCQSENWSSGFVAVQKGSAFEWKFQVILPDFK